MTVHAEPLVRGSEIPRAPRGPDTVPRQVPHGTQRRAREIWYDSWVWRACLGRCRGEGQISHRGCRAQIMKEMRKAGDVVCLDVADSARAAAASVDERAMTRAHESSAVVRGGAHRGASGDQRVDDDPRLRRVRTLMAKSVWTNVWERSCCACAGGTKCFLVERSPEVLLGAPFSLSVVALGRRAESPKQKRPPFGSGHLGRVVSIFEGQDKRARSSDVALNTEAMSSVSIVISSAFPAPLASKVSLTFVRHLRHVSTRRRHTLFQRRGFSKECFDCALLARIFGLT